MPAAKVNFNEINLTQTVPTVTQGVNFVLGRSIRGPFADPDEIFNSWPSFVNRYGGLMGDSDAPLLVKRLLEKGGSVRFCRVGHYNAPDAVTDPGALTAVKATALEFSNAALDPLFKFAPKYAGADFNNISVEITAGSNGQTGYFNVEIKHSVDVEINEKYTNLKIEGKPTLTEANFLLPIVELSQLVEVEYLDLSYIADETITPDFVTKTFTGGDDGGTVVASDYIGDSAKRTGFYSFDPYQDAMNLAVLDNEDDTVHSAGSAYAANRKDMVYFIHLSNSLMGKADILTKRDTLAINTKYTAIYAGGLKVRDPFSGQIKEISGLADILALANKAANQFGPWYSFAGNTRGLINDALGVVNNFGSPAKFKDLDDLANKRINMIINRDNSLKLWGNFSAQFKEDQERYLNVVRLVIYIKTSIRPTLEDFLEEPNDIPTWRRLYYTVKPFFDNLVDSRALYSYTWLGDQDAPNMDNLKINKAADVSQGKYKVNLQLKAIPSIQEINMNLILTPAGVDFETVEGLI